jgi:8-oxo-dGTP pyrophosphatase MutT (NUDIX family)
VTSKGKVIRDAATVVLLRDGVEQIETWLLRRLPIMEFAAGVAVFPGGAVDARDGELPWSGSPPDAVASAFGCSVAMARALVGAAVREVFEETGVLLTRPASELTWAQPDVEAGRLTFGDLLSGHGLVIDSDALRPWAHWITPAGDTRRYDTHFFVAALPPGAAAADLTSESTSAEWMPLRQAIAERESGRLRMLPPTISVITSIADFATVADVFAAARGRAVPVTLPIVRKVNGKVTVELPDGSIIAVQ